MSTPHRVPTVVLYGTILGFALAIAGCSKPDRADDSGPRSLLGAPLPELELAPAFVEKQERLLEEARARTEADPNDVDAWIWVGRRQAYLGRYADAIETFTHAMTFAPEDARLYRHRGHRWITLRQFDRAIEDLSRARDLMVDAPDRVEPDGLPNAQNTPTSTLYTNVYYHLGLAHYLEENHLEAHNAYTAGLRASKNPDMTSAMVYWLILTHWSWPGDMADIQAFIHRVDPDWELIENHDYHAMVRSFAPGGDPEALLAPAAEAGGVRFATVGYGVGAWHWNHDRRDRAIEIWEQVVADGPWNAFGAIAAEAMLARLADAEN